MKKIDIDKNLSKIDLLKFCYRKIIKLIRGNIIFLFHKGSRKIYVGEKTQLRNKRYIKFNGKIVINDYVEIDGLSINGICFGDNINIGKYSIIRASGRIAQLGKGIKIGNNFSCGDFCFFGSAGGIEIGDDVIMGQCVRFHAQNHKYQGKELIRNQGVENKGIKIGNNCWIGSGVVFLDGVTIGDGCVIGANSVVTHDFPDNSVVVGYAAKMIKKRF